MRRRLARPTPSIGILLTAASLLIVSAAAALVSLAESMASLRGEAWSLYDFDGDGVANDADDCSLLPNPSQSDCDGDLRGDSCDGDVTGDGLADRFDSDALVERVGAGGVPYAPGFDMNCDARIDAADLGLWRQVHGPTGCGGAIPCTPR